jgi:hypothetical protein
VDALTVLVRLFRELYGCVVEVLKSPTALVVAGPGGSREATAWHHEDRRRWVRVTAGVERARREVARDR